MDEVTWNMTRKESEKAREIDWMFRYGLIALEDYERAIDELRDAHIDATARELLETVNLSGQ